MEAFHETLRRLNALKERFFGAGIYLKPGQIRCLEALYIGKDVLAVLPTGYGKSLIFQLIPFFLNPVQGCNKEDSSGSGGIVIVIAPLNSIIEDHLHNLSLLGIKGYALKYPSRKGLCVPLVLNKNQHKGATSDTDSAGGFVDFSVHETSSITEEVESVEIKIPRFVVHGEIDVLFCHPESLLSKEGRILMRSDVFQRKVVACVIDEVHCVDKW